MHYCPSCRRKLFKHGLYCEYCGQTLKITTIVDGTVMKQTLPANSTPSHISTVNSRIATLFRTIPNSFPVPIQNVLFTVLDRAQDAKPEVSSIPYQTIETLPSPSLTWGRFPLLALLSAVGLFLIADAYTHARDSATGIEPIFWVGLLLVFTPIAVRLLSTAASRFERVALLCLVDLCLYVVSVMNSPLYFSSFDAMLHWRTVNDIVRSGHLFSKNAMLPASPFYPGIEIVTNALSMLSGMSTFNAGLIVVGVGHVVIILSLFLLCERMTNSARIAAIAAILYISNPQFVFFDAQFSYESLALPLATFVLFIMAYHETLARDNFWIMLAAWISLASVVVTHHMTDFFFDGLFLLWVLVSKLQHSPRFLRSNLAKTALFGVFVSFAWTNLSGNPVVGYLSSYFVQAFNELGHIVTGTSNPRQLFVSYTSHPTPLWERVMVISSVIIILLCLPFGLLCLWQRYRNNILARTLGLIALLYPLSHVFRFTNFGSEISDRAAAFLFLPVSCVLALFIVQFYPVRSLNKKQISLIACAMSVVFLGGFILGSGPPRDILPGPYVVAGDEHSVEPEGIQAALWTLTHLGPDNHIGTDRTNQMLMNAYGEQSVVTGLGNNIEVAQVFFSSSLSPYEVSILKGGRVGYLAVDLRLAKALPDLGFYFDESEPGAFHHTSAIPLEALTKFNTIPGINRIFDSGNIVIYDVGGFVNAPEEP